MASAPVFATTPKLTHARISTANTNRDGTGTLGTIATGTTNGSRVDRIVITATVTTTAGMIRFFIHDGTNFRAWREVPVSAITVGASTAAFTATISSPVPGEALVTLPSTYTIQCGTHNAESFDVVAHVTDLQVVTNYGIYPPSEPRKLGLPYLCLQDQKTSGTGGGTFTAGAWQTRTLNTIVSDSHNLARLVGTTQLRLAAGTYQTQIAAVAAACDRHQARLQNISSGETLLLGTNSFITSAGTLGESVSYVSGRFRLYAEALLEVQHRCQTTRATDGFGFSASWGTEVYLTAEFWREI